MRKNKRSLCLSFLGILIALFTCATQVEKAEAWYKVAVRAYRVDPVSRLRSGLLGGQPFELQVIEPGGNVKEHQYTTTNATEPPPEFDHGDCANETYAYIPAVMSGKDSFVSSGPYQYDLIDGGGCSYDRSGFHNPVNGYGCYYPRGDQRNCVNNDACNQDAQVWLVACNPGAPKNLVPTSVAGPGMLTIMWGPEDTAWPEYKFSPDYYALRIDDMTADKWLYPVNCPAGGVRGNTGDVCVDDFRGTSYSYNFQAGHTYNIWVHARSCGGNKWSAATSVTFTVGSPITPTQTATVTPTPTGIPYTIGGALTLNPGGALAGQTVIIYDNDLPAPTPKSVTVTTDAFGWFRSPANWAREGDLYSVNPLDYGIYPPLSTTGNLSYNNGLHSNQPLGSPSYQAQKANSNDCSSVDPANGKIFRCDFRYVIPPTATPTNTPTPTNNPTNTPTPTHTPTATPTPDAFYFCPV